MLKPLDIMRCHLERHLCGPKLQYVRWALVPYGKGRFGGRNPQFTAVLGIAKLFWPLCVILI